MAHRVTRALAAIGLVGAKLTDCLVLTGWTPWGPLAQPNAYFTYDGEAERTKEWAIHCHASQVLLTDYTQYCSHLGRAYAALVREWAEGHSLSGRAHRTDDRFVGVELFQIETYDPAAGQGLSCRPDPDRPGNLERPARARRARRPQPRLECQLRITNQDSSRRPDLTTRSRSLALMYVPAVRRLCRDEGLGLPRRGGCLAWPPPTCSRTRSRSAQIERGRAVLGLATGSTPEKVYAHLVERHRAGSLSFRNVTTYNLDEYYPISPLDPRSYRAYMHRHLFSHVDIAPHRAHVLDGTVPEAFAAGARRRVRPLDRGRRRAGRPASGDRPQRPHRLQRAERLDRRRSPPAADPPGRAAPGHPRRRGQGVRRRWTTSSPGP